MTTILVKNCDGGHICHPPKECCKQGCCYPQDYNVYRPPTIPTGHMFNPLFLGHWYFWAAITATLAGIVCACSLWKRHNSSSIFCCKDSGRDERASEPDSNGSCYAPPQYSRCSSFHQAPPPYSEVASKPDMYPLVLSYNGDTLIKTTGQSRGYLMVQYFRNFIVRPVGSLSATSTVDSLSSSFICNTTNEANIIPPPYSCMGSLEEVNSINNNSFVTQMAASTTMNDLHHPKNSPSVHSCISMTHYPTTHSSSAATSNKHEQTSINYDPIKLVPVQSTTVLCQAVPKSCDAYLANTVHIVNKKLNLNTLGKERSVDSESQDDDHNFSDLLNLSVCMPSNVVHLSNGMQSNAIHDFQQSYSVTNSMTSSDISSLANLGTPDSPPRATSPTVEMRELLDKIQQLPQQRSPIPETPSHHPGKVKSYFNRTKAKTLYMPLQNGPNPNQSKISPKASSSTCGIFTKSPKGWLSRSAPNTPSGNYVPTFTVPRKTGGSQKGSKVKINNDGSPLLDNQDESDDEHQPHKDESL